MPKKDKGRKKNSGDSSSQQILYKEEGQEYAHVLKMLGGSRFSGKCTDGITRLCTICGTMRNKGASTRIAEGDLVLVSIRGFEEGKADCIHKYSNDEVRQMKKSGIIEDAEKKKNEPIDEDVFDFEAI